MVLVPIDYKMIADESEPSLSIDYSTFSDSSNSIFSDDEYEINKLLQRRTSVSLFNVSTPLAINERNGNQHRSVSHFNIQSDRKKRKYVPYSNEYKDQSKTIEEPKLKIEHLEMPIYTENLNVSVDNISHKYAEALKEIESLKMQINKIKCEQITPVFVRRKSLQSSMIKNLFRNSSTSMRQNHNNFATSFFGTNSTCMTIDIEDQNTSHEDVSNDFLAVNSLEAKDNPFFIKTESPISNQSYNNSEDLLIHHSGKKQKHSNNKMRSFVNKFLKCPSFLHKIINNRENTTFNNRISPIPKVVIMSPSTPEHDSGNDSDGQQIRLDDMKCNTPNVERVMTDLSKCAAELSEKLSIFKNVLDQCMNQKNIVNT